MAGPPPSVTEYTERSRLSSLVEPRIVSVVVPTAPMVAVPEAMLRPKIAVRSGSPLPASRVVIGERRRRVGRAEVHDGTIRDLTGAEVLAGRRRSRRSPSQLTVSGEPSAPLRPSVISLSWPRTDRERRRVNWTTDAGGATSWICSIVVVCAPSVAAASGMLSVIGTVSVPSTKPSVSRLMVKLARLIVHAEGHSPGGRAEVHAGRGRSFAGRPLHDEQWCRGHRSGSR